MAAYAALVSLINNMEEIIAHPRLSNCFVDEQIHSLLQKAGSLLEFVEEGYNHEDLEREITFAAHAAEDVVESHVVDQIHAGTLCSVDLQQVIQGMGAIAGKAMEVKEKGVRKEVLEQPPTHPASLVWSEDTAMVGLDDELTQLLDSLADGRLNRHVISIVGMGGTGKTTLAQNLYEHQLVKEHFDIRAWATLSQKYSFQQILAQLLSCLGKSTEGKVGELGDRLHKTLYGRRYLIVLDDIWSVEAWDEVRRYLSDDGNGSRVVLTTRLSNVASVCGSTCFHLSLLDDEKSWKLFSEKALFLPHKDDPLQLENVAKRIVKLCNGLALSIVVIGGLLLNSPRTIGCWVNVLKGLQTNDSKEKQQGLDALSLSYNHLPPHLKPCFLYMGVFKEDSTIRVSSIAKLWVAEGFIKTKGSRVSEEIAEDYLKDLSDRNLVLVANRRYNGKIKSFNIHDLVRDLCIKVAEQQQFFHIRKYGEIQDTERRLVYDDLYRGMFGNKLARSILGRNKSRDIAKCKLMRVLNATQDLLHRFPAQVYGNVNLRYLAHHQPSIIGAVVELPTSACLLWNLQTLIIKLESPISPLVVAPSEIWKMRQLRHVECHQVYLPDPPPSRNGQDNMENLQTLTIAVNLRLSEEVCEIIPNIKKLHLIYDAKMQGYNDSLIECLHNLDRFHKLESLNMKIKTSKWPRPDPELHSKLAFPLSLNKLCLSECKLCWKDLSLIGSLPQLQVLCLKYGTVDDMGLLWRPISGQFRRLKFLEIEGCDAYGMSVDAESSHFPVLEKLLLRRLAYNLEIPPEIGEIPTLKLIRVDRCSESAAISAVKIKKDQLENQDNHALQIEVRVYQSRAESLKKSMEAEELALNLFKLEID